MAIDEKTARLNYYTTSNIYVTAYLLMKGFKYDEAQRYNKSLMFFFKKSIELDDCVLEFFANKDLREYIECIKEIRLELKKY